MGTIVYESPQGGTTDWQTADANIGFDESTNHWLVKTEDGETVRRIPRERVYYVESER